MAMEGLVAGLVSHCAGGLDAGIAAQTRERTVAARPVVVGSCPADLTVESGNAFEFIQLG